VNGPIQIGARRTGADIAVQIVGRAANLALGVVVTLVIVRSLGQAGFGEWSTIFAISQIAANLGELGLTQIAVSRAASDPEREANWMGALFTLRLALGVPLTAVSLVAVILIAPTSHAAIAGVLISSVLLLGAPSTLTAIFQLRVRNDISTAILTFNSVIWAAAVFIIAAVSGSIIVFAVGFLVTTAITNLLTGVLAHRISPIQIRGARELWGPLVRVGAAVGLTGVLVTFYVKLDQILVLELAGRRPAGLYAAAYRVLEQAQFIPAAVMTTLFPVIASCYPSDLDRVRRLLQRTAEYLALASLPILVFTIVAAHQIVGTLFGADFYQAGKALPILMAAFVSISFGYIVGNMVVVLEEQRRFFLNALLGLVINAVLNVLLIPRYGFVAAAWITLLTEVTVMTLTSRVILKRLGMRPQLGRLARTLAAATTMGCACLGVRAAGAPFSAVVAVAVVSYLTAILLLRAVSVAELISVLREK
jgi:O-antigen/teichoic acid export membrane protein